MTIIVVLSFAILIIIPLFCIYLAITYKQEVVCSLWSPCISINITKGFGVFFVRIVGQKGYRGQFLNFDDARDFAQILLDKGLQIGEINEMDDSWRTTPIWKT